MTSVSVRSFIQAELETRKREARHSVSKLLDLDIAPLYTQNGHYFSSLRQKWLIRYKDARRNPGNHRQPIPTSPTPSVSVSPTLMAPPSRKKKVSKRTKVAMLIPTIDRP